ncbi:MAG: hypothetical protein CM15mP117_18480 [Alphaproteobacteria bacterium]|nr:MAG: hypothetical protein CM15mP117_18480 [Alphaproteobacteria bacterium]
MVCPCLSSWNIYYDAFNEPRGKKDSSAFEPEDITRLTNFCVIGIIIGGRLGFVLFYNFDFYISNPIEIFKVWNGGMSFHGGLLGVIIATILTVRKTKIPIFQLSDLLACLAPMDYFWEELQISSTENYTDE